MTIPYNSREDYKKLSKPEIIIFSPAPVLSLEEVKVSEPHFNPFNRNVQVDISVKLKKIHSLKEISKQYENLPFDQKPNIIIEKNNYLQ